METPNFVGPVKIMVSGYPMKKYANKKLNLNSSFPETIVFTLSVKKYKSVYMIVSSVNINS